MSGVIGIDLGTTFSVVARLDETGRPVIVRDDEGKNIVPSCVHFEDEDEGGQLQIGEEARKTAFLKPDDAAAKFKRDMGTSKNHSIKNISFTPTELSAAVLKRLKEQAESQQGINDKVSEAVVTVPANFSNEARNATLEAAKIANLNVKYIINEPTAAALYYAYKAEKEFAGLYAVYDLGGGTFDISIIRVDGQDVQVVASNGLSRLGGDDFDLTLRKIVSKKFTSLTGKSPEDQDLASNDWEEHKKSLSRRKRVKTEPGEEVVEITQDEFNEAISSSIGQIEMLCESTLDEAGVSSSDLQSVILVGGSTRIPAVRESAQRIFGQEPVATSNVDEVVALGAALYAAYRGDRQNLNQVQRASIDKMNVQEIANHCFGTIVLQDEGEGGERLRNSILIEKNTKIPCKVSKSVYTVADGQTSVKCQVTQSTSAETDPQFVSVLWSGDLSLPEGRPEGQEIEVRFSYDQNQIMHCAFTDVATGKSSTVDIDLKGEESAGISNNIDKFLVE